MKLNGKILVAVAMMVGSFGAIGCNAAASSAQPEGAAEQPAAKVEAKAETPAASDDANTVAASTSPGVEQDSMRLAIYVPFSPPAVRFENPGRAPTARHFWVNGYHKYVGGRYIWVGGHWDVRRNGHTYVQPHYDRIDGRVRFMPGHFVRR